MFRNDPVNPEVQGGADLRRRLCLWDSSLRSHIIRTLLIHKVASGSVYAPSVSVLAPILAAILAAILTAVLAPVPAVREKQIPMASVVRP